MNLIFLCAFISISPYFLNAASVSKFNSASSFAIVIRLIKCVRDGINTFEFKLVIEQNHSNETFAPGEQSIQNLLSAQDEADQE